MMERVGGASVFRCSYCNGNFASVPTCLFLRHNSMVVIVADKLVKRQLTSHRKFLTLC